MLLELPEIRQQPQDRRGRIPDRDSMIGDQLRQLQGLLTTVLPDQDDRRTVLDRQEEVEDGQIEMERSVRRKFVVGARIKLVRAPVHETQGRGMRVHHALRYSRGSRRIEDVGKPVGH
jgi:hypothetical protein